MHDKGRWFFLNHWTSCKVMQGKWGHYNDLVQFGLELGLHLLCYVGSDRVLASAHCSFLSGSGARGGPVQEALDSILALWGDALGHFAAKCEVAGRRISTSVSEATVLDRRKMACPLQVGVLGSASGRREGERVIDRFCPDGEGSCPLL